MYTIARLRVALKHLGGGGIDKTKKVLKIDENNT